MKLFLLSIFSAGLLFHANGQTMHLPPLYNPADLVKDASTLVHNYNVPFQVKPVSNLKTSLPQLTSRWVQAPVMIYPFSFLKFEAERQDDASVKLVFETTNEFNSQQYTIERVFLPGSEFQDITQTADTCYDLLVSQNKLTGLISTDSLYAKNEGEKKLSYSLTDDNNFAGISFYRITEKETDNSITTTEIKAVPGKILKESFLAYPNPTPGNVQLNVFSKTAGTSTLRILNMQGSVLKMEEVNLVKGNNTLSFNCGAISNGMYHIELLRDQLPAMQTKIIKL